MSSAPPKPAMASARRAFSAAAYASALACHVGSVGWVLWLHLPFWLDGQVFLGSFTGLLLLGPLTLQLVLWGIGILALQRPRLDMALLLLTALAGFALWAIPARFTAP